MSIYGLEANGSFIYLYEFKHILDTLKSQIQNRIKSKNKV